jgi:hypothetical protein
MTALGPVGERVYRGLLKLYPSEFRRRFGDDMVQLFDDELRDAHTGSAAGGTTGAWLRVLGDVAMTASTEHLRRNRTVAHSLASTPPLQARALGVAGIIGGLVLLAAFVITIPAELNTVRIVLFNVGSIAIVVAVHRRQAARGATLALIGAVPAVLANAWYAVMVLLAIGRSEPVFAGDFGLIFFWAGVAMHLSDAWFGFVTLRIGAVSRVGAGAVAIGALLSLTGMDRIGLTDTIFGQLSQVGIAMVGVGWILLGIDVATRRLAPAPPAAS